MTRTRPVQPLQEVVSTQLLRWHRHGGVRKTPQGNPHCRVAARRARATGTETRSSSDPLPSPPGRRAPPTDRGPSRSKSLVQAPLASSRRHAKRDHAHLPLKRQYQAPPQSSPTRSRAPPLNKNPRLLRRLCAWRSDLPPLQECRKSKSSLSRPTRTTAPLFNQ